MTATPPYPALLDPLNQRTQDKRLHQAANPDLVAVAPVVGLMDAPGKTAEQVNTLLYGETAALIDTQGDFVFVAACQDSYIGWARRDHFSPFEAWASHRVTTLSTLAFATPSAKAPVVRSLPMGACVTPVTGDEAGQKFIPLTDGSYVPAAHIAPMVSLAFDPVDTALAFLGVPYGWGGRSFMGIDCSGLVQLAALMVGVGLHRDCDLTLESLTPLAGDQPPKRGTIAGFKGHIGIMLDQNTLLHANQHHMAVTQDPVQEVIARADGIGQPFTGFYALPL